MQEALKASFSWIDHDLLQWNPTFGKTRIHRRHIYVNTYTHDNVLLRIMYVKDTGLKKLFLHRNSQSISPISQNYIYIHQSRLVIISNFNLVCMGLWNLDRLVMEKMNLWNNFNFRIKSYRHPAKAQWNLANFHDLLANICRHRSYRLSLSLERSVHTYVWLLES